jgi:hypothetical protein
MKKLLLILLFIPLISFGQKLNEDSNGYTEVIEVELSKKEIHQKINEWIAINYKSAQDVIQLNTVDKIVTKGNYSFPSAVIEGQSYGVRNILTFSIRDNKYKIDLIPNSMFFKSNMKDTPLNSMTQYFKEIQNFEDFKKESRNNTIVEMQKLGYSLKRATKMVDNYNTPEITTIIIQRKKLPMKIGTMLLNQHLKV